MNSLKSQTKTEVEQKKEGDKRITSTSQPLNLSSSVFDISSPYISRLARIDGVARLTEKERLFKIAIEDNKSLGHSPGQFIMLSIPGYGEAPISISSPPSKKNTFEICVRAVGNLTNALHRLTKGDRLWIRGPYGKPFPVVKTCFSSQAALALCQ